MCDGAIVNENDEDNDNMCGDNNLDKLNHNNTGTLQLMTTLRMWVMATLIKWTDDDMTT